MQPEKTGATCTPDTPIDAAASHAGAPRGHRTPSLPSSCTGGGVLCPGRRLSSSAKVWFWITKIIIN